MCRNIRTLFNFEPPATELEIRDASLQFVRKLSGFNVPSQANREAFELDLDQLAWRRNKTDTDFRGDSSQFDQEYPASAELAFAGALEERGGPRVGQRPADRSAAGSVASECRRADSVRMWLWRAVSTTRTRVSPESGLQRRLAKNSSLSRSRWRRTCDRLMYTLAAT